MIKTFKMKLSKLKYKSDAYLRTNTILNLSIWCTHSFSFSFYSFNSIYSTGINGNYDNIKTWPLADLSGYFVIGYDSSTHLLQRYASTHFLLQMLSVRQSPTSILDTATWWYQIASSSFSVLILPSLTIYTCTK